jgi:hypothetical protein
MIVRGPHVVVEGVVVIHVGIAAVKGYRIQKEVVLIVEYPVFGDLERWAQAGILVIGGSYYEMVLSLKQRRHSKVRSAAPAHHRTVAAARVVMVRP